MDVGYGRGWALSSLARHTGYVAGHRGWDLVVDGGIGAVEGAAQGAILVQSLAARVLFGAVAGAVVSVNHQYFFGARDSSTCEPGTVSGATTLRDVLLGGMGGGLSGAFQVSGAFSAQFGPLGAQFGRDFSQAFAPGALTWLLPGTTP